MKRAILVVLGLTTLSTAALAQGTASDTASGAPSAAIASAGPQMLAQGWDDQRGSGRMRSWRQRDDNSSSMGRDDEDMGSSGRRDGAGNESWYRSQRATGDRQTGDAATNESARRGSSMRGSGMARFRLRRGENAADIRCPGGTALSACVEAAAQLLDKLGGSSSPGTTASPTPPTPPANH